MSNEIIWVYQSQNKEISKRASQLRNRKSTEFIVKVKSKLFKKGLINYKNLGVKARVKNKL